MTGSGSRRIGQRIQSGCERDVWSSLICCKVEGSHLRLVFLSERGVCDVIVLFCQLASHGCVSRCDVIEAVLSQDLVDILLLVDAYFSRFLLDVHAQILGALAFVRDLKGFTELGLEFEDRLQVAATDGHIINV